MNHVDLKKDLIYCKDRIEHMQYIMLHTATRHESNVLISFSETLSKLHNRIYQMLMLQYGGAKECNVNDEVIEENNMVHIDHALKTDPIVFDAVIVQKKKFEIRFNDRKYKVGDVIYLLKTQYTGQEMKEGAPLIYTGDSYLCRVTHILHGPIYGLADNWVIMSIEGIPQ